MTQINKQPWGQLESGEPIQLFTLRNSNGIEAAITNFGGRLVSLKVPGRDGHAPNPQDDDIVLGFDNLAGYTAHNPYFGALVGRYANRIANGQFQLNGRTYQLPKNNGPNSLHGGLKGFDSVPWHAQEVSHNGAPALELKYFSKDGEEGYPGNLHVSVTYSLSDANELKLDYEASTDNDTVLNLTNHSYFDLAGQGAGTVLFHRVTINADRFTPVNANLIPTGELRPVEGTPFDFRTPHVIGDRINEKDEQLGYGDGYDHNFVLNRSGSALALAARVEEPTSGRVLEVLTTQPGMQFYTGNHLHEGTKGKAGKIYGYRYGFCVETQHFPDSPNHPDFPTTVLKAGQHYSGITIFKFSVA